MRPDQAGNSCPRAAVSEIMRKSRVLAAAVLPAFFALFASVSAAAAQDAPPPPALPDTRAFLDEVRQNLRSDNALLEQYTFSEVFTEKKLDARGAVKKTKVETYEVYPSVEPGRLYRRLVARDGEKLSENELADQDRKQEEKTQRRERRAAEEDEAARQKRLAKQEANRAKEQAVVDEVFLMDDIRIVAREAVEGRPTIVLEFSPRPGYKPVTEGGKVIQKLAGRAWIDEQDRQLVRLEARLLDTLGVGPVRIARLQKGASAYFVRRKVNGEIWLPSEARFTGAAKALLVFNARIDIFSRYFDYRKFSVGTEEEVLPAPEPSGSKDTPGF
jgi:hypothetical protein